MSDASNPPLGPKRVERQLKTATSVNQIFLKALLKENMTTIDGTLGKGNDAKLLLDLTAPEGKLYGFDIQAQALEKTRITLQTIPAHRYQLFDCGHHNIKTCGLEPVDFAIFNLGYLPTGDKSITTLVATTVSGLAQAFDALRVGGFLMVTVYPGHEEGSREAEAIAHWLKHQPQSLADVLHYEFSNHRNAPPHTYLIEKRSDASLVSFGTIDKIEIKGEIGHARESEGQ